MYFTLTICVQFFNGLICCLTNIKILRTVLVILNAADGTELQYSGDGHQGKEGLIFYEQFFKTLCDFCIQLDGLKTVIFMDQVMWSQKLMPTALLLVS